MGGAFLRDSGSAGAVGALLDEYARAAEELCRVVEAIDDDAFLRERSAPDPHSGSRRAACQHVADASIGYANYLVRMQGRPAPLPGTPERAAQNVPVRTPRDLRPALVRGLRATEDAAEALRALSEEEIDRMSLRAPWGTEYTPESILEHAIVHLLRHRRQLERWDLRAPAPAAASPA